MDERRNSARGHRRRSQVRVDQRIRAIRSPELESILGEINILDRIVGWLPLSSVIPTDTRRKA